MTNNLPGEIVITGAGPAGLAAALTVAKAGARAIVCERLADVGGRFHDDFQGIENWTTRGDVLEELKTIGIEPSFEAAPISEVVFFDHVEPVFRLLAVVGLSVVVPSLWAQQSQSASGSPGASWSAIQQLVQNLESVVHSKNLHEIHEPSMKIRAPIRALKQHCSILGADTRQKMVAALKQLDNAITDLHSAADAGNQKDAESALKEVETAFDQLKSLDPETAFESTR